MLDFFSSFSADTSRHFLPIDVIKQVIESMSYAKLVRNVVSLSLIFLFHSAYTIKMHSTYIFSSILSCPKFLHVLLLMAISFSRMFFIGTSLMNSRFLWRCPHIHICGKVHIQSLSATLLKMLMILLSKISAIPFCWRLVKKCQNSILCFCYKFLVCCNS